MEFIDRITDRLGGRQRIMLFAVGIGAIAFILGVSWWASRPSWVPVFNDLPIASVGKLSDKLTEAGVPFRFDDGGTTLLVQSPDVARARVALAREGLPTAGRPGLELFDQPSWGMTDFTQRINYRRALEGELERTIGRIRDVQSAEVHLALNETSSFRQAEKPGRASVVLKLRDGTPSAAVVQGISQLVASSVGGMSSDDVMVLDETGRLLSIPNDGGAGALTSRQLAVQRDIESYIKQKAEQIVTNVVGSSDARVQVSAQVNFDRLERTSQIVDPDKQATVAEQKAEIVPGAQGGAASNNRTINYENSRTIENYASAIGTVRRITVAVLLNATPGDSLVPPTAAQLASLKQAVSAAVGADSARGDVISVQSVPFRLAAQPKPERMPVMDVVRVGVRPAVLVFGLVLAFIVALRAIRSLRPAHTAEIMDALDTGEPPLLEADEHDSYLAPVEEPRRAAIPPFIPRIDPAKERVSNVVQTNPELAVRLVRGWLKEA